MFNLSSWKPFTSSVGQRDGGDGASKRDIKPSLYCSRRCRVETNCTRGSVLSVTVSSPPGRPGLPLTCCHVYLLLSPTVAAAGEFVLDGGSEPMSHKEENDGSPAPAQTGPAVTGLAWSLERAPNTGSSRMTNHNKLPACHSSLSLQIRDWTDAECWTVSVELWLSCHRGEASLSAVGISAAISLDKSALIEYSVPEHSWLVSPLPVPSRLNKLRR